MNILSRLGLFLIVLLTIGCKNNSKIEERLNRLENENQQLRQELKNATKDQSAPRSDVRQEPTRVNEPSVPSYPNQTTKFAFVVLSVTIREYDALRLKSKE